MQCNSILPEAFWALQCYYRSGVHFWKSKFIFKNTDKLVFKQTRVFLAILSIDKEIKQNKITSSFLKLETQKTFYKIYLR